MRYQYRVIERRGDNSLRHWALEKRGNKQAWREVSSHSTMIGADGAMADGMIADRANGDEAERIK